MKLAQEQLVAITLDEQNQVAKLEQLAMDMKLALERENEEKIEEERNWKQSYGVNLRKKIEAEMMNKQEVDKINATDNSTPSKVGGSNMILQTPPTSKDVLPLSQRQWQDQQLRTHRMTIKIWWIGWLYQHPARYRNHHPLGWERAQKMDRNPEVQIPGRKQQEHHQKI